jgi:hypothetical protein
MATKLHELLAVEESLNVVLADSLKEATASFSSKDHLFKGHVVTVEPLEEDVEGHLAVAPESEVHDVAETVHGKLDFVLTHLVKAFNVYGQKEKTNQEARADLKVGGEILIADCPATMLLGLETRLKQLRQMCLAIKTTDQSKGWTLTQDKHVVQARPDEKFITRKVQRERVVIEPTEHQPGQFTVFAEDVRVGKKVVVHKSGLVSPKEKSDLLGRIDVLLRAAKKARQRANTQEVDTTFKVGKVIKSFILNGTGVAEEDE